MKSVIRAFYDTAYYKGGCQRDLAYCITFLTDLYLAFSRFQVDHK